MTPPQYFKFESSLNSAFTDPLFISKQVCLDIPENSYKPAIANIRKKKIKIMKVSLSKGIDRRTATTSTYSPLMLVTAFKGLRTLKALKAPSELFESPPIIVCI